MECEDDLMETCFQCGEECRIVTKINVEQSGKLSNSSMQSYFLCIVCLFSKSNQRYSVKRFLTSPRLLRPEMFKGEIGYIMTEMKGEKDQKMFGLAVIKTSAREDQDVFWPFPIDLTVQGQTVFIYKKNQKNTFAVFNAPYISKAGSCAKVQLRFETDKITQPCYIASFVVKKTDHSSKLRKEFQGKEFFFRQYYNQLLKKHPSGIYFGRICPCTKQIIRSPVRFKHCRHLQCFQASFIDKMLEHSQTITKCPLCGITGTYNDLIVDDIQQAMLQQAFQMLIRESDYVKRINQVVCLSAKTDKISLTVTSDPKLHQMLTDLPQSLMIIE